MSLPSGTGRVIGMGYNDGKRRKVLKDKDSLVVTLPLPLPFDSIYYHSLALEGTIWSITKDKHRSNL